MISSSESAKRLSHQCGKRIDMKNPVSPSKHIEMPNEFPGAAKEERTGSQSRVTDWKMRPQPAPGPSVPQDAGTTKSRLRPRNGLVEELFAGPGISLESGPSAQPWESPREPRAPSPHHAQLWGSRYACSLGGPGWGVHRTPCSEPWSPWAWGGSGRRGWDTQSPSLQALWGQRSRDRHAPLWAGARLPPPWPPVSPVGSDLPVPTRARRGRALTCSCRLPRTSGAPRCSARTSGTSARGAGS